MKNIPFALALGFTLSANMMLDAKNVEIETGHWLIDRSRFVEIDNFDYFYQLNQTHLNGRYIELMDGSIWEIEPLGPESTSFYRHYKNVYEVGYIEELVDLWQPGELLIFHKIADKYIDHKDGFLVYNVDRDLLVDVTVLSPPIYCSLTVSEIDTVNQLILLSDSSVWQYNNWDKAGIWYPGDSILVAKDTPWRSDHTHVLINMEYCDCEATMGHIHRNRISVNRMQ
jgi:hypothetical protein